MTLMQILIECENSLGWVPEHGGGKDIYKARAITHKVITLALERHRYSVDDFALALAYCKRKRLPVDHPLQLIPLVLRARELAAPVVARSDLNVRQGDAIAWEHQRLDDESTYWIGRIVNSVGAGLDDALTEWKVAGRG
jgi:hypothetical protein